MSTVFAGKAVTLSLRVSGFLLITAYYLPARKGFPLEYRLLSALLLRLSKLPASKESEVYQRFAQAEGVYSCSASSKMLHSAGGMDRKARPSDPEERGLLCACSTSCASSSLRPALPLIAG